MQKVLDNQLRFDLPLDETVDEARQAVSQEEARRISEAARGAWEKAISYQQSDISNEQYGKKEYFEDYLRLRELGWPWRVATYIAWASSPKGRRWPETIEKLATEVLGLSGPRVIYQWRGRFPTIDAVVAVMQAAPLFEHRRDVINALVEQAGKADYKSFNDRKLFLEMTGDYTPQSKLKLLRAAAESEGEMSDEELRALLGEVTPPLTPPQQAGEGEEADPPNYGWRGDEGEGDDAELGGDDEEGAPW